MKMKLCVLLLLLFTIGCNATPSSDLESVMEEYPDVQEQINSLPKDLQEKVKLPESLPFEFEEVNATIDKHEDGITALFVDYLSKTTHIYVNVFFKTGDLSSGEDVTLDNGIKAKWLPNGSELRWKDGDVDYFVGGIKNIPEHEGYSKSEILEIANSMY